MRSTRSSAGASLPAPRLASSPASPGWARSWTRSADRLAAYAGLVPAARDSGKRVGNHCKGRGGNRVLKRVFYQSAFSSMRAVPESRAFYDRKRREGKRHAQAVIALARRRVNVLWAMLRDGATFEARSAA
jgi:transposase